MRSSIPLSWWALRAMLLTLAITAAPCPSMTSADEVGVPQELLIKLDEFERQAFAKPESMYAKGKWKEAMAAYDAYCLQYPKSDLVAFAYLRKGRCQEMGNKRLDAIKTYQDVVDFFPNLISAAAPAVYYQGRAYMNNGDETDAMRAWAKMAADPGYSRHILAAKAVNELADFLVKKERAAQAIPYYTQVALDFRESNGDAARHAIRRIVHHHVRVAPDEEKLRDLYLKAGTFAGRRQKAPADPTATREYWWAVVEAIRQHDRFTPEQAQDRQSYAAYWSQRLKGRFPDWDDYQLAFADYQLAADGDGGKWTALLDAQYSGHQKPGDDARTLRWMRLFVANKKKVQEYYAKLDLVKMPNPLIRQVMEFLYEGVKDADLGRAVAAQLRMGELDDGGKESLATYFWSRDVELAGRFNAAMQDQERATFGIFTYHAGNSVEKALPLADKLIDSERYGAKAADMKGEILVGAKRYAEAIEAFRRSNNAPESSFKIANCYARMGKVEAAVDELSQVENLVPQQAARAAMAIANLYRNAGATYQRQMVASYRKIIARYKGSRELSQAHVELEKRGIPSVEAVEADDEKNPGNK